MKTQSKYRSLGFKSIFVTVLSISVFLSCNKPPQFDKSPAIEFNKISKEVALDPDLLVETNNIRITLNFKDGDGDLGVLASDASNSKYRDYSTVSVIDGDSTFTFRNYYLNFFRKNGDEYVPVTTMLSFDGTFEPLIDYDEVGPIEGELDFEFKLIENSALTAGFMNNDTIRFEVYIVDRSLNESNKITTSDIILFEKL